MFSKLDEVAYEIQILETVKVARSYDSLASKGYDRNWRWRPDFVGSRLRALRDEEEISCSFPNPAIVEPTFFGGAM